RLVTQRCVRKTKAKRKLWRVWLIDVARNVFFIVAIGKRRRVVLRGGAAGVERIVVNRNLSDVARPRHRKPSRRTCFAKQSRRERGASLNSREPRGKNRRNMFDGPGKN